MDLEGNLSTTIVKKPVAPSTSRSNNGQQPTQDVGREAGPYRIRVKRIKQEQPISERLDEVHSCTIDDFLILRLGRPDSNLKQRGCNSIFSAKSLQLRYTSHNG